MEDETSKYNIDKYKERIGSLAKGVAVIKVGGFTEVEMQEKKDRVDDAIGAVRSAISEGTVAGGGTTLFGISETLNNMLKCGEFKHLSDDQLIGVKILIKALKAPFETILINAGLVPEVISSKMGCDYLYNVATGQYEKYEKTVVLDPAKVTRSALQNAVSIAGLVLTTEVMIGFDGEDKTDNLGLLAHM